VSRLLLRRTVEQLGHECLVAADGAEAWRLFQDAEVDVVISDWMMPGLDGIELCRRVRARPRATYPYFVLLTALGDRAHLLTGLQAGADDYLAKPLDREELRVRLQAAARVTALYRRLDEQRRRLAAELGRAAQVQADLLPRAAPAPPGFELAARCVAAHEVGGDFYDWQQPTPDDLTLTVGDVMGKGMPAALLMATVRAALRAVARRSPPAATVRAAAAALEDDLARAGSFVTLFHGRLDAGTRRLDYVDAGHGHVFLRRAGGGLVTLPTRGLPVGVLPQQEYRQGSVTFRPGDTLLVYSDGLVDAGPGPALRPARLARRLAGAASAAEAVERLLALAPAAGPPPDDLTVVALRCLPEPAR